MEEVPQNPQCLEHPDPVHLVPSPQIQRTGQAASSGLPNMAIYPASEEGATPPSLATGFSVEPDHSLPSIIPSPPKPHSPRAPHHH